MNLNRFVTNVQEIILNIASSEGIEQAAITPELKSRLRAVIRSTALYANRVAIDTNTYKNEFIDAIIPRLRNTGISQGINIPDSVLSNIGNSISQTFGDSDFNEIIMDMDDTAEYEAFLDNDYENIVNELENIEENRQALEAAQDTDPDNTPSHVDEIAEFMDRQNTPERIESNINTLLNVNPDTEPRALKKGRVQKAIYNYIGSDYNQADIDLFKFLDNIEVLDSTLTGNPDSKIILKFSGDIVTKTNEGIELLDAVVTDIETILSDIEGIDVVGIEYTDVDEVSTSQTNLKARQNSRRRSSINQESAVAYKYINMSAEEVKNMLGDILFDEVRLLSSKYNVNVTNLYPGGPLITAAQTGHKYFVQDIFEMIANSNELQSILDNSKLKWVILGGNKKNGSFQDMNLYKGGVSKYFKRLQRNANPETKASYKKINEKPGYVLGLEFTDPSGRKHIVTGMVSDGEYSNSISFNTGSNQSDITTNFFNFDPDYGSRYGLKGYFPNTLNGLAMKMKGAALTVVRQWWQGVLGIADKEEMILTQSPINAYVGNFYQRGGFLFESVNLVNETFLDAQESYDVFNRSMIRFPNKDVVLDDGWKIPNAKHEWTVTLKKDTNLIGRPSNIQVVRAKRSYFSLDDIEKSPRHNAIKYLMNVQNANRIQDANRLMLNIAGIAFGSGSSLADEVIDYIQSNPDTKYIFKYSDINNMLLEIYKLDPKIIGQIIASSEQLKRVTGIDLQNVSDDVKQIFNYKETLPLDIEGGISEKSLYQFIEIIADSVGPEIVTNNLKIYKREDVINDLTSDVELNEWIYDVNETTLQTTDTTTTSRTTPIYTNLNDVMNSDFYSNNEFGFFSNRVSEVYDNMTYDEFSNDFTGMHIADDDYIDWAILTRSAGEDDLRGDVFTPREIAQANRWGDITPINTNVDGMYYLDDTFRHNFLRNIQYTISSAADDMSDVKLLAADVEYMGAASLGGDVHDYFEIGVIYEKTEFDGTTKQYRIYETVRVESDMYINSVDANHVNFLDTVRTGTPTDFARRSRLALVDALGMTFTEQGYTVNHTQIDDTSLNGRGRMLIKTHPSGRIGRVMDIAMPYPGQRGNYINNFRGAVTYTPLGDENVRVQQQRDLHQENLEKRNNQTKVPAANVTESQIQTFYSQHELDYLVNNDGRNPELINKNLEELFNFIDNKTTGAVQITFNNGIDAFVLTKHTNQPLVWAAHIDSLDQDLMPPDDIQYLKNNLQFPEGSEIISPEGLLHRINKVTFLVPNEDIVHNVLPSFIKRLNDEGTALITDGSNVNLFYVGNMAHEQPTLAQYRVTANAPDDGLYIYGDPDSPDNQNVRANYGYGQSMNQYDDRVPLYQQFNETRVPVGNNPSTRNLREMARAFAQTKTGKGLGYAWKTIDIGETLISKAFAQAQKAALAAGAVGLGGAAATAATVWAFYEIGNLIFSVLQGIPELYNVNRKRNEILLNGEQWEKDFVEDTFWQDYGPELLEILQEAGDRSPAEMLSEKIWTFTLDNLFKQSQGEVIPEALVDDSEELDMRDDLWYANVPNDYKIELMQDNIDYDKVLSGYYNNRPEANVIMNRTLQLANDVYNRDRFPGNR